MNVAGAALIISLILVAAGAAMWVALWTGDRSASWRASVYEYLPAVADFALIAAGLRVVALVIDGAGTGAFVVTVVIALAAAILRQAPDERAEPAPVVEPEPVVVPTPVEYEPRPEIGSLWLKHRPATRE
jgi:hypothetical protein